MRDPNEKIPDAILATWRREIDRWTRAAVDRLLAPPLSLPRAGEMMVEVNSQLVVVRVGGERWLVKRASRVEAEVLASCIRSEAALDPSRDVVSVFERAVVLAEAAVYAQARRRRGSCFARPT